MFPKQSAAIKSSASEASRAAPPESQPEVSPPSCARAEVVAHPPRKSGQVGSRLIETYNPKRAKLEAKEGISDLSFSSDTSGDDERRSDDDEQYFARGQQRQMTLRVGRFEGPQTSFGVGPSPGCASNTPIFRPLGQQVIAPMQTCPTLAPCAPIFSTPPVRRPIIQLHRPAVSGNIIRIAPNGGGRRMLTAPLVLRAPGSASTPAVPIRLPAPRMIAPPTGGLPVRVLQVVAVAQPPPRIAHSGRPNAAGRYNVNGFNRATNDAEEEGDEVEDPYMLTLSQHFVGTSSTSAAAGDPRSVPVPGAVIGSRPAAAVVIACTQT